MSADGTCESWATDDADSESERRSEATEPAESDGGDSGRGGGDSGGDRGGDGIRTPGAADDWVPAFLPAQLVPELVLDAHDPSPSLGAAADVAAHDPSLDAAADEAAHDPNLDAAEPVRAVAAADEPPLPPPASPPLGPPQPPAQPTAAGPPAQPPEAPAPPAQPPEAPEVPHDPEAPRPQRQRRANYGRSVDPNSIPEWGPFALTFTPPKGEHNRHGRWQGLCPYHAKNSKTACTRSIALKSSDAAEMDKCKLVVMYWCLQACTVYRHKWHKAVRVTDDMLLPEDVMLLRAMMMPPPPPKDELLDDEFLDALALTEEAEAVFVAEAEVDGDVPAAAVEDAAMAAHAADVPADVPADAASRGADSGSGAGPDSSDSSGSSSSSNSSRSDSVVKSKSRSASRRKSNGSAGSGSSES